MKFQQLIILSIWEIRRVLSFLNQVPGEAKRWFLNVVESQESFNREEMGTVQQVNSSLRTIQPLCRTDRFATSSGSYVKQPGEKCVHLSHLLMEETSIVHISN